MLLISDVDDVLLDWFTPFKAFLQSKNIPFPDEGPKTWNLNTWLNLSQEETLALITEFNSTEAFGKLQPIDSSVQNALWYFHQNNAKIIAITSCGEGNESARTSNLLEVFGYVFDEIICLPLGFTKLAKLEHYKNLANKNEDIFWVEDRIENAKDGIALGFDTILYKQTSNKLDYAKDNLNICVNWSEIKEYIKEQINPAYSNLEFCHNGTFVKRLTDCETKTQYVCSVCNNVKLKSYQVESQV